VCTQKQYTRNEKGDWRGNGNLERDEIPLLPQINKITIGIMESLYNSVGEGEREEGGGEGERDIYWICTKIILFRIQ
jgi:hypothetical protein